MKLYLYQFEWFSRKICIREFEAEETKKLYKTSGPYCSSFKKEELNVIKRDIFNNCNMFALDNNSETLKIFEGKVVDILNGKITSLENEIEKLKSTISNIDNDTIEKEEY